MNLLHFKTPMKWPSYAQYTPAQEQRYNHDYKSDLTVEEALDFLEEEIKEIKADSATLYSDVDNIQTGGLRRNLTGKPGVSLEIHVKETPYFLVCDRWRLVQHNIYALHLLIRHYRMMERFGVAPLERLMQGFTRQAAYRKSAHAAAKDWRLLLPLAADGTLDDAHAVYRVRAKKIAHDPEKLLELNMAFDEAKKELWREDTPTRAHP